METNESQSDTANNTENSISDRAPWLADHRWKPGQSGNPSGRPKKRLVDEVLTEILEANDSRTAIELARKLIERALEGDDTRALQLIAERTQGKPAQKVEVTGEGGGPVQNEFIVKFVDAK